MQRPSWHAPIADTPPTCRFPTETDTRTPPVIRETLGDTPVVCVLGPRQTGKTNSDRFRLERPLPDGFCTCWVTAPFRARLHLSCLSDFQNQLSLDARASGATRRNR